MSRQRWTVVLVGVLLLGAAGCVAEYGEVLRDEGRKPAPPRRSRIDNPAPVPVKGTDDWASLPGLPKGGHLADPWEEGALEDQIPLFDHAAIQDYIACHGKPKPAPEEPPLDAPNIVVIIADDLPRGLMGFEGNSVIETPHLDLLFETGIYFENFYLPLAQCAPSRSVLWTSLYPTANGVQTNEDLFKDDATEVLPHWLHEHGYRTGFFGKCHIGTSNVGSLDVDWDFDSIFHMEGDAADNPTVFDLYNAKVHLLKNAEPAVPGVHLTKMITERAIDFLDGAPGKPMFIWLSHRAPHPLTLWDSGDAGWTNAPPGEPHYTLEQMPVALHPEKAGDTLEGKPPQQRNTPSRYGFGFESEKPGGVQEHMRRAHEQMRYLDEQVGVLLAALEERGMRDDTLIVFLSDNGGFFGERQLCWKGPFLYDEMVRVPLLLSWPAKLAKGVRSDALIQSTDLTATLLEAAGLPPMPGTSGRSFWPVALGSERNHRRSVFFQYHSQAWVESKIRGVLKDGYKLSHYLASYYFVKPTTLGGAGNLALTSPFTWELYDLSADPNELTNLLPYVDLGGSALESLLADPEWRPRINDLARTLAEYQTEAQDDEGVRLEEVEAERTSPTTAKVSWKSVKVATGEPINASSEVVYREAGCPLCTVFEMDYKSYGASHTVLLDSLSEGVAYEALLFSITPITNGGVARIVVPPEVGDCAGPVPAGALDLDYRTDGYVTEVRDASGPAPLPTGLCLVETNWGATLVDKETTYPVCIDECRLLHATAPGRNCTWDGTLFQNSANGPCTVYDATGAKLFEANPSFNYYCAGKCLFYTQIDPNAACYWNDETLQEHAAGLCHVEGGMGETFFLAEGALDTCLQECELATLDDPATACNWAEVVIQTHPKDLCLIVSGAGETLFEMELTAFDCYKQCIGTAAKEGDNYGCFFGSDVYKPFPTGNCLVLSGCDEPLLQVDTTQVSCQQQCDAFLLDDGHARCTWESEVLQNHPYALCKITGSWYQTLCKAWTTRCECVQKCELWSTPVPNCHCMWGWEFLKW